MRKGLMVVVALLMGFALGMGVPPNAQAQLHFPCDVTITNNDTGDTETLTETTLCWKLTRPNLEFTFFVFSLQVPPTPPTLPPSPPLVEVQVQFPCNITVFNETLGTTEDLTGTCTKLAGSLENIVIAGGISLMPPPVVTHNLIVNSINPASGVPITVTPPDNNGDSDGVTPFMRVYDEDTVVTLTAPATLGGNVFKRWLLDGVPFSASLTIMVTMDADHTATAEYETPPTGCPVDNLPHDCR